ncbi:uncharacterized protein LOC131030312 isoform X2 [Cryptomeria japonica]|uniref:uncharacterized protein LOC131030312 isoform X2 n=1 Tax=Cryptomeria japonica TaxID=3369 RepID=UPI0027DA081E|nr:uncharacterized protein LOC131030312 isoform X2 [Cryptomeria japonica]
MVFEFYPQTMKDTINAWMTLNKEGAEAFSINIIETQKEFVKLETGGYTILLTVPPTFHDASSRDDSSVFVAVQSEEEGQQMDDTIKEVLLTLNEKLERVRIGHNCLNNVLDILLQVFRHYRCKKKPKICDLDCHSQNQGQPNEAKSSYLYKVAEEARVECVKAFSRADESSIVGGRILPWCSVSVHPNLGTIKLSMEIDGIMASDNVTKALGFCFGSPLKITLSFKPRLWLIEEELPPEVFRTVEVSVCSNQVETSVHIVPDEWDDRMKVSLTKCCFDSIHQYGPQVLVPALVWEFFKDTADDLLLHGLQQAEESNNVFTRLLNFIGIRLSTMGSWCCNCKKELSPLSRSWYCDAELWHEELGVGASVLQELQNSELIELELSLAMAASTSDRDVFEPYPTFLLKQREIRGRSGSFSTDINRSTESLQTSQSVGQMQLHHDVKNHSTFNKENKKMDVLMGLINSFPPVAEMQECQSEFELRLRLSTSLQKFLTIDKFHAYESLGEEFVKDLWLPYNVLRFVLFTNRLYLHLLQDEFNLQIPNSYYQFAVLYDSEREQYYEHCRATKGSFFAYHGSPTENWYSILRNGLRCLSGTQYMSSGMAHGRGIYFSDNINVSAGYCKTRYEWANGKFRNCSVIAICEIFLDTVNRGTYATVVPPEHENNVVIRYLIVFSGREHNILEPTSNLELHEHYKKVRAMHLQKLGNKDLAMQKQRLAAFNKRRGSTQCSF